MVLRQLAFRPRLHRFIAQHQRRAFRRPSRQTPRQPRLHRVHQQGPAPGTCRQRPRRIKSYPAVSSDHGTELGIGSHLQRLEHAAVLDEAVGPKRVGERTVTRTFPRVILRSRAFQAGFESNFREEPASSALTFAVKIIDGVSKWRVAVVAGPTEGQADEVPALGSEVSFLRRTPKTPCRSAA